MTWFELIQSVASIATAVGVGIAAWQLRLTKQQEESQFEDSFAEQYRTIAARLPLDALLGRRLSERDLNESLRAFYNYFDLCNEQVFLAKEGRFRDATWDNWRDGIEQHFRRPAFAQAWNALAPDLDGSFDDLRAWLQAGTDRGLGWPQSVVVTEGRVMERGIFTVVKFDEGGVRGTPENQRLVCVLDGGGKLAIWGSETDSRNVDLVAGLTPPFRIQCDFQPPGGPQARTFGHTHWVKEGSFLQVLP